MSELKCNSTSGCLYQNFENSANKVCMASIPTWEKCDWGENFMPKPQPDELGKLIEEVSQFTWPTHASLVAYAIKILAERVSQQQNVNNMQAANNREVYNRAYVLEDRIKKLEERESRCHGDPESGDPADINQNPQANNPLTKEEILAILTYAPEWECDDRTCNQAVAKLYSYLEK